MLRQTQQLKSNNTKKQNSNSDKNSSILVLLPGDVKSFHFPSKLNEKILQIKTVQTKKMVNKFFGNNLKMINKYGNKNDFDDNNNNKHNNNNSNDRNDKNRNDDDFDDTSDDDSEEGKKL
jgi:hypothetical protein